MPRMIGHTISFPTHLDVAVVSETVLTLLAGVNQVRVTSQGGTSPGISGLVGGTDNQAVLVFNVSGAAIDVFVDHPTAPSTARFVNGTVLDNGNGCLLWRDPLRQAWRVLLSGGNL